MYIGEWICVAKDIIRRYGNIPFYCDPARTEQVAAFQKIILQQPVFRMIRIRIRYNPCTRTAAPCLDLIKYFLIRQRSLVNVCPKRRHTSDPSQAADRVANKLGIDTPQYILAGYSLGNIQDNILTELSNKYGFEFRFDKYNNFTLFGVKVRLFRRDHMHAFVKIRIHHPIARYP